MEQLLQDLRRQYPEAKEVEGNEDEKHGVWAKNNSDKKIILSILKETFGITKGFYFQKKKLCFDVIYTDLYEEDADINTITLFRAISEAINSNKFVTISFVEVYYTKYEGAKKMVEVKLDGPQRSGGAYIPRDNAIYIWDQDNLTITYGGETKTYYQDTLFWHELGHFLKPEAPGYAIYLENFYRKIKGREIRNYDITHPRYKP